MLLKIRKGECNYKEVAEIIENGMAKLEEIKKKSPLREEPNHFASDLLVCKHYAKLIHYSSFKVAV